MTGFVLRIFLSLVSTLVVLLADQADGNDSRLSLPAEASASKAIEISTDGPLASRLSVVDLKVEKPIDVGTGYDNPASFWDGRPLRPVIFAPQPNGGAKIGWTDSEGVIHITPVDANFQRIGVDMIIKSCLLRDLVAHDDGSAVLVLQNGGMHLLRIQGQQELYRKKLISNWCRDIHLGSLAWNGEHYAAYFAVHRGGHEGDALKFVSPNGTILPGGWNWGCSHSIDMRVVAVGKRFMPLALSDAYPGTGLFFNHNKKRVSYTWGDHRGGTGGRIGGLVALGDKMFVAFSSKQGGRRHWTAALADFAQEAPHTQTVHKYLEDSNVAHRNVKIARYGSNELLVSWLEDGTWRQKFQRYDSQGMPVGEPEILPVRASARADFKNAVNGDVVWAHTWGEDRQVLKLMRIRCR